MKKIMAAVTAVLFVSALMVANMAFADDAAEGAIDKAAAPMSDKAKDGDKVSKDAKDKEKAKHAKMKKKGKKSKKSKKRNKKKS